MTSDRVLWGRSLLPANATVLELALSETFAEAFDRLPRAETIPDVLSWERCPFTLLPWLAWEWSVDEWAPGWPEAQKRAVIAASWDIHSVKGTIYALERAIDVLGLGAAVREWWAYGGQPFTFRLDVAAPAGRVWTMGEWARLYRVAIRTKNVRSFLERIELAPAAPIAPLYVAGAVKLTTRLRHTYGPLSALAARGFVYAAGAVSARETIRLS